MPIKVNGLTTGSVTLAAPDTGSDVTMTLPGSSLDLSAELASKLPIAGGKILQIVRATDSTDRSTTSGTFVDASISVAITPQKNDSAILLIWSAKISHGNNFGIRLQITDNSNNAISGAQDVGIQDTSSANVADALVLIGYATPAISSEVTYKGRFCINSGGTGTLVNSGSTGQLYAIEVSA